MGLRSFWSSVSIVTLLSFPNDNSPNSLYPLFISSSLPADDFARQVNSASNLSTFFLLLYHTFVHIIHISHLNHYCIFGPCVPVSFLVPLQSLLHSVAKSDTPLLKILQWNPLHQELRLKSKLLTTAYKNPWSGFCWCLQEHLLSLITSSALTCFSYNWLLSLQILRYVTTWDLTRLTYLKQSS